MICQQAQLPQGCLPDSFAFIVGDWIQNLLVEDGYVVERAMTAVVALVVFRLRPVQRRATTLLAEVVGKWLNLEETQKRKEFPNAVLNWSATQTPFIRSIEGEAGFGHTSCA